MEYNLYSESKELHSRHEILLVLWKWSCCVTRCALARQNIAYALEVVDDVKCGIHIQIPKPVILPEIDGTLWAEVIR